MPHPPREPVVEFVQHLRPSGHERALFFEVSPDVAECAGDLQRAGYTFEADVVISGFVLLSCYGPRDPNAPDLGWGEVVTSQVVNEESGVRAAVSELVVAAHRWMRPDDVPPNRAKGSDYLC